MKFWFDTEFIEDGKTIELLSIGVVAEDGREYYAESIDAIPHYERADPWVKENVIAHLKGQKAADFVPELRTRQQIAADIVAFCGEKPEFWAYYADYDWVVLCQLHGRMIDLPLGWPMFCRDLKQRCADAGDPTLPQQTSTEHHALEDARWTRDAYAFLEARANG